MFSKEDKTHINSLFNLPNGDQYQGTLNFKSG
jgi:hypothetical protein